MILPAPPSTAAPTGARVAPSGPQAPLREPEILAAAQRMTFGPGAAGTLGLLRLLADPSLSPAALAGYIGREPALAIRVLRVANSAFYGHAGQVATLGRAAQVLGVQALRGIALAACFDGFGPHQPGRVQPDMVAFRRHSLATACAAQELARALAPGLSEQAFMAGLLHDLGLLLLWRLRPPTAAGEGSAELPGGLGHADCGRVLMQAWSLPAALTQAVAEHEAIVLPVHGAAAAGDAGLTLGLLLALAEALAHEAGYGLAGDTARPLPTPGEPLHAACAGAADVFPGTAMRLLSAWSD